MVYGRPTNCSKCDGELVYAGIGEYKCENCGNIELDDYGKVRSYLEEHHGATQSQVSDATGVASNVIRQMLREEKIEIAPNSRMFLRCLICGTEIRSGRYCPDCEAKQLREEQGTKHTSSSNMHGFGNGQKGSATGERRFMR